MLSKQTLVFLRDLVNRSQLPVGQPEWRQTAQVIALAQDELAAAIAEADEADGSGAVGPRLHPVVDGHRPITPL